MSQQIEFSLNQASEPEICEHLFECDTHFVPPLSARVEINSYARKIADRATRFEAWANGGLVGLVAVYCGDRKRLAAYVTNVSVLPGWQGRGIASRLMRRCVEHLERLGVERIDLEVNHGNVGATRLYEKLGFMVDRVSGQTAIMHLNTGNEAMNNQRDYNSEFQDTPEHKYAYNFDFDVMHPYMIRSFEPFFVSGSLLELGSFKGAFTQRLLPFFDDMTCVEASQVAIEEAKHRLKDNVQFMSSTFEKATLPKRYDNVVMIHVLEHLDDPVRVLKRINDEWLAERGRLFLVCPNANAPSRQIAVKMGLITHNAAVTPAEAEHGHRCTYSLDTLERDAVAAGLKVRHRSGIFFKALANFQWDRLLDTDIISKEYLEGCYELGQQYPDLCASVFLMCERGHIP